MDCKIWEDGFAIPAGDQNKILAIDTGNTGGLFP